jgi:hypothetical protein
MKTTGNLARRDFITKSGLAAVLPFGDEPCTAVAILLSALIKQ